MAADSKVVKSAKTRRPPNAGKGRVRGVPNKVTGGLRQMILGALDDAGGQAYLTEQARENPNAFLALIGKALPLTVHGDDNGGPVKMVIEWAKPSE